MPRYFKNIEPLNEKKKKELKKMWDEVKADAPKSAPLEKEQLSPKEVVKESPAKENKQSEQKRKPAAREPFLWTFLGLLIVVGGFLIIWYLVLSKSSVTIRVRDQGSNKVLSDVLVTVAGMQGRTDTNGLVQFKNLESGEQTVKITYSGYKETDQLLILKRGSNGVTDVTINLDRVSVSGVVLDYIDKKPVDKALVSVSESTASSDQGGLFTLDKLSSGNQTAVIAKSGYFDTKFDFVTTQDPNENVGDLRIVPQGRAVFASNRDSDQAVYTAHFDGSNAEKLWDNVKGFDDSSPILSPNSDRIVFFSNRDNEQDSYGNLKVKLYYYNVAAKSVAKISDDSGISNISWNFNGTQLLYLNTETQQSGMAASVIKSYDFGANPPKTVIANSDFEAKDASGTASISLLNVSPTENMIIFAVYNSSATNKQGIYLLKTDGTDLKRLTDKTPVNELKFSSDGKALTFDAYVSNSIRRYSINLTNGKETSIPFEEKRRGYYSQTGYETREALSSDKSKKVFIDYRDGKNDLYLSNPDGSGEKRLTYMGNVYKASFIDNRYVIFGVNSPNETALYVLGLEQGNAPIKITDTYPAGFAGIFPD